MEESDKARGCYIALPIKCMLKRITKRNEITFDEMNLWECTLILVCELF